MANYWDEALKAINEVDNQYNLYRRTEITQNPIYTGTKKNSTINNVNNNKSINKSPLKITNTQRQNQLKSTNLALDKKSQELNLLMKKSNEKNFNGINATTKSYSTKQNNNSEKVKSGGGKIIDVINLPEDIADFPSNINDVKAPNVNKSSSSSSTTQSNMKPRMKVNPGRIRDQRKIDMMLGNNYKRELTTDSYTSKFNEFSTDEFVTKTIDDYNECIEKFYEDEFDEHDEEEKLRKGDKKLIDLSLDYDEAASLLVDKYSKTTKSSLLKSYKLQNELKTPLSASKVTGNTSRLDALLESLKLNDFDTKKVGKKSIKKMPFK